MDKLMHINRSLVCNISNVKDLFALVTMNSLTSTSTISPHLLHNHQNVIVHCKKGFWLNAVQFCLIRMNDMTFSHGCYTKILKGSFVSHCQMIPHSYLCCYPIEKKVYTKLS